MRISFAGDRVGFGLRSSSLDCPMEPGRRPQSSFSLDPKWIDLTPAYDPTGRASELDLLQDATIDLSTYSVTLDWRPGTSKDASLSYSDELRLRGLAKVESEDCKTILSVYENRLFVTCFLPEETYAYFLRLCEDFASWPNPKGYSGRAELPILHNGLLAAMNPQGFFAFLAGELPLYSNRWLGFSVFQNCEIPVPPTDWEKHQHHFSQV